MTKPRVTPQQKRALLQLRYAPANELRVSAPSKGGGLNAIVVKGLSGHGWVSTFWVKGPRGGRYLAARLTGEGRTAANKLRRA